MKKLLCTILLSLSLCASAYEEKGNVITLTDEEQTQCLKEKGCVVVTQTFLNLLVFKTISETLKEADKTCKKSDYI